MLVVRGQIVYAELMEHFQELIAKRVEEDKVAFMWKGPKKDEPLITPVRMMPKGPLNIRPDVKKTHF